MLLQRLDFKEFDAAMVEQVTSGTRVFHPASPKVEEAPPPPVYTGEDLSVAESRGYRHGFIEGVRKGRDAATDDQVITLAELSVSLKSIADQFGPLIANYRTMSAQLNDQMPKLALSIARKVAGNALDLQGHEVIHNMITQCCKTMLHEPKLTITIHESMAEMLATKLQELSSQMPAGMHIAVVKNPDMPKQDCKISWAHGSMERSTDQLWQKIEQTIDSIADAQRREQEQQLDLLSYEPAPQAEPPQA